MRKTDPQISRIPQIRAFPPLVAALVFVAMVCPGSLSAQTCFNSRPLPRCRSFWITEVGLSARLDSHLDTEGGSVTVELGYMVNAGARSAFGISGFFRGGEPVGGVGIRPRYRLWLGKSISLDVAPGIVLKSTSGGQFTLKSGGFSGQLALNIAPGIGLVGQVDQVRLDSTAFQNTFPDGKTTDVAWYAGGRLSGGAGVAGILAFLALGALVAATW